MTDEFFVILGHFLPFYPPNNPTNQNFEKMIKLPGDIFILHLSTTMIIIWCMVPEIWISTTELCDILDHFLPFYPLRTWEIKILKKWKKMTGHIIILHMCTINENHDVWFLRNGVQQTEFFVILSHFCPFSTLTT